MSFIRKALLRGSMAAALLLTAGLTAGCEAEGPKKTDLKDMSTEGYELSFYQRARGTSHNREIRFVVDNLDGTVTNLLEGTYENTGTDAPEHLRDPQGRMVFTQTEFRRYFDTLDNARIDKTNITLFNPLQGQLSYAKMARFQTEWWGNSDLRAIAINNGPLMLRLEGQTNHLGIKTQNVFAVVIPEDLGDYSWMFNQDRANETREYMEGLQKRLEATDFRAGLEKRPEAASRILISTKDYDRFENIFGLETAAAQGSLFDGKAQYFIAASYLGPNNLPFVGGLFVAKKLYGHPGAPDKGTQAGSSLDTVTLGLGTVDRLHDGVAKARIVLSHPTWSNQTEYRFIKVHPNGEEELMGSLQRSYNDKTQTQTTSQGDKIITDLSATNNYLARGNLLYMQDVLVLLGGQQVTLGFDYKTSYGDYALALMLIGRGLVLGDMDPELVAGLNVNADATIGNVTRAARSVLGLEVPPEYEALSRMQLEANKAFHEAAAKDPKMRALYGLR